jgi:hypothetical protein
MAHQKEPAVPQIAMAASTAVKREAPNKLIAAIRQCAPYLALARIHRAAAPWRISENAYSLLDKNMRWVISVPSHCAGNSTKCNLLARADARRLPHSRQRSALRSEESGSVLPA